MKNAAKPWPLGVIVSVMLNNAPASSLKKIVFNFFQKKIIIKKKKKKRKKRKRKRKIERLTVRL